MAKPNADDDLVTMSFQGPRKLKDRAEECAEKQDRSFSSICRIALCKLLGDEQAVFDELEKKDK